MDKKNYVYIFLLVLILVQLGVFVFPLASCFYSCEKNKTEQKKICRTNEAQAKKNAVSYIEKKYGFKADAIDAKCDYKNGMFGWSAKNFCVVTMEYDRKFYVSIDGSKETDEGWDSYQYKEIENCIIKRAEDVLPGAESYKLNNQMSNINLDNAANDIRHDTGDEFTFYQKIFDGNDLKGLFKDAPTPIIKIKYNSDISYKKLSSELAEVFLDLDIEVQISHDLDSRHTEFRSFDIINGRVDNDVYQKRDNKE